MYIDVYKQDDNVSFGGMDSYSSFKETLFRIAGSGRKRLGNLCRDDGFILYLV